MKSTKKPNNALRKKRYLILTIALTTIALFILAGFVFAYFSSPPVVPPPEVDITTPDNNEVPVEPVKVKEYKKNFYTFIVTGTDHGGIHTDTIMVISLDTTAKKINIVSVPRDTQVDVPRNPQKINTAYAVGGVEELKKEIESILGFSLNIIWSLTLKPLRSWSMP
jgi:anionic cell wall polymer biosynthesis LytR-Cps2A-Psr (LCP) family protein